MLTHHCSLCVHPNEKNVWGHNNIIRNMCREKTPSYPGEALGRFPLTLVG